LNGYGELLKNIKDGLTIALIGMLIAGIAFGAGLLIGLSGQPGGADPDLGEYRDQLEAERARIVELTDRVTELTGLNGQLSDNLSRAKETAHGIADRIDEVSRVQGSLAEKLRGVIEALKVIQTELRNLAMD
jgi:chromosome segregation ATPase